MGMEINGNYNNYSANNDYIQKTDAAKETAKNAETDNTKELGVITEVSKDPSEIQKITEIVRQRMTGGIRILASDYAQRNITGNISNEDTVPVRDDSEKFKEMEAFGRTMIPKIREALKLYGANKADHKELSILRSGAILNDDNYYNSMITNNMPSVYGDRFESSENFQIPPEAGQHASHAARNASDEYERKMFGVSEEADNLFKAYANAYYEIEKGYADGTRIAYVQDDTSETGYRQLTKEEEIEKLNKAYEKQVKVFERRNDPKIAEALEETAKKIEKIKSSQNKGVTSDSVEELEKRRAELEKLPKSMEKNFLDAAKLFTERFNAQKPGMVNIADITNGISVFGKLG